ncbi:MAG: hypothetical protein NC182_05165 [Prevotella sp.]|nr:hypothetical protein [Staphylococcus sp.]MCM1350574.1 hypothetical protein [Prevotella sp.]
MKEKKMQKDTKQQENQIQTQSTDKIDNLRWLFAVVGFLCPVAGYVLYLVWKQRHTKASDMSGWAALLGVFAYIIFFFVWVFFIK